MAQGDPPGTGSMALLRLGPAVSDDAFPLERYRTERGLRHEKLNEWSQQAAWY